MAQTDNEIVNCILKRDNDSQSFGFTILTQRETRANAMPVPIVEIVEQNSTASLAGLKVKDQIFEINGKSTYQETLTLISNLIRNSKQELYLVVSRDLNFVRI